MTTAQVSTSPSGIRRSVQLLGVAWGGMVLLSLVLAALITWILGVLLFVAGTAFLGVGFVQLILAKSRAIRDREAAVWCYAAL